MLNPSQARQDLRSARMLIDEAIRLSVRACIALGAEAKIDRDVIEAQLTEAQQTVDAMVMRLSRPWFRITTIGGPLGAGIVAYVCEVSARAAMETAMTHLSVPDDGDQVYSCDECSVVEVSTRYPILV